MQGKTSATQSNCVFIYTLFAFEMALYVCMPFVAGVKWMLVNLLIPFALCCDCCLDMAHGIFRLVR